MGRRELSFAGPFDGIYYDGDCWHSFVHPGDEPCLYYLVMDVTGRPASVRQSHTPIKEDGHA